MHTNTQLFGFKLVDIRVSEQGFVCKVSVVGEPAQKFRFVAIPHGKYTSLLMLDFLLAEKRCSQTLLHLIEAALKADIQGQEYVMMEGEKSAPESLFAETAAGAKPHTAGSAVASVVGDREMTTANMEELGHGVKPLDDHKLRIVRDVPLSLRAFERMLEKAEEQQSLRKSTDGLEVTDALLALRRSEWGLRKPSEIRGGREETGGGMSTELLSSLRELHLRGGLSALDGGCRDAEDGAAVLNLTRAQRSLQVQGNSFVKIVAAGRLALQTAHVIDRFMDGIRNDKASLYVGALRLRGVRKTRSSLTASGLEQATKYLLRNVASSVSLARGAQLPKSLEVDRRSVIGRLKIRQFPTLLSESIWTLRVSTHETLVSAVGQGERGRQEDAYIQRGLSGLRDIMRGEMALSVTEELLRLHLVPTTRLYGGDAWRNIEKPLSVVTEDQGERVIHSPLSVVYGETSWRINSHGLYVWGAGTGTRDISKDTLAHAGGTAERVNAFGLYAEKGVFANRVDAAPLRVVKDMEGARQAVAELALGTSVVGAGPLGRKTSLIRTTGGQRESSFDVGLTLQVGGGKAPLVGRVLDSLAGANRLRHQEARISKEMLLALRLKLRKMFAVAEFIPATLFEKIFPAFLMEDMLFAEKEAAAYSTLLECLVAYLAQEDYGFIAESSFLGGVVQRISYLEALGVLGTKQDGSGLLIINAPIVGAMNSRSGTVESAVVGESTERLGAIETDNPYGWLELKHGESAAVNMLGQVHLREAGALLEGVAGEVLAREGHGHGVDALLGEAGNREGILPERAVVGEAPPREGSYPEQVYIGGVPHRFGTSSVGAEGSVLHRYGDVGYGVEGEVPSRNGAVPSEIVGGVPNRQGSVGDHVEGALPPRGGAVPKASENRIGRLREDGSVVDAAESVGVLEGDAAWVDSQYVVATSVGDIAHIVAGYVLSRHPQDRDAFLDEIYRVYATPNRDRVSTVIEDFGVASEGDPFVSYIDDEAIAAEYNNGNSPAFLDESHEFANGLVYDYLNDVLEESSDVELWVSGFAIPEEYNSRDPLNVYHPQLREVNGELLMHENWVQFDRGQAGTWHKNPQQLRFESTGGQQGVSGLYRNNFDYSDYVFWTEMRVEGANDAGAGVVFKYKDEDNFYRFVIHGGDLSGTQGMQRPMQLFAIENGRQRMVGAPISPHTWQRGKKHMVRVESIGDRIRIWVDNRLQYDVSE